MGTAKLTKERRQNIVVGLTTLGGLVGFVLLLAAFGYVPTLLRNGYEVTLYTDDIAGLRIDSRVTLWGKDIGEVSAIGFSETGPERAYLKLRIDEKYKIPEDVDVRIQTPLFGGGPMIALTGSDLSAPKIATDGSATLRSAQIIDPLVQLEAVTDDIADLKQTWADVGQNFNSLFGEEGGDTPSLPSVVRGLDQRLNDLGGVLAGAEAWLGDKQLRDDITQTAANARKISEELDKSVKRLEERYIALAESAEAQLGKVDKTLGSADKSIKQLEERYSALAKDAGTVVAGIDRLVAKAESKDSTIGMLLSDPQLYHNLTDTSERLKLMVDEARLLIEKWEAEGVPLKLFD